MKLDKKTDEMDTLLRSCLHMEQTPDDVLHQKVMEKWKEQSGMKKRKFYKAAAAAAAVVMVSTLSAGAAMRFFTPKEAAEELEGKEAANLFESEHAVLINETQEGDQYNYTLLGLTEGENLLQLDENGGTLEKDAFYAVMAISNKDGSDLSVNDFQDSENDHFISPLIQGLEPWMYNIASMNGGYSEAALDGVVYRMINCDKIGYFADRRLYLCVSDTTFYETEAYHYDEESGVITRNNDYNGTNLLFDLPIDKSMADAALAEEYLKALEEEWNQDADEDDENEDDTEIKNPAALADYTLYLETLSNTPQEVEAVLANMGMTAIDQQTVAEKDGGYNFKEESEDEETGTIFYEGAFTDGLTDSGYQYSESETESRLVIEVVRLNEDKTATRTFYEKTYANE